MRKLSIIVMFLLIFTALGSLSIAHVSATAPTITVYGISPANAGVGTMIRTWLTYTDADNDAPTYVRVTRQTVTGFEQLQVPNPMTGNNSGDTTYSDGKTYYYDWYYFPFVNTGFIRFEVKSGADAEVVKTVPEFQEPSAILSHSGVTPIDNIPGNYTFFTNYTSAFNSYPYYINVSINGTNHAMTKNDSADSTYVDGVNYSYTQYLGYGNHSFTFHTQTQYQKAPDVSEGTYWILIQNNTVSSTDLRPIVLGVFTVGSVVCIGVIGIIPRGKKNEPKS